MKGFLVLAILGFAAFANADIRSTKRFVDIGFYFNGLASDGKGFIREIHGTVPKNLIDESGLVDEDKRVQYVEKYRADIEKESSTQHLVEYIEALYKSVNSGLDGAAQFNTNGTGAQGKISSLKNSRFNAAESIEASLARVAEKVENQVEAFTESIVVSTSYVIRAAHNEKPVGDHIERPDAVYNEHVETVVHTIYNFLFKLERKLAEQAESHPTLKQAHQVFKKLVNIFTTGELLYTDDILNELEITRAELAEIMEVISSDLDLFLEACEEAIEALHENPNATFFSVIKHNLGLQGHNKFQYTEDGETDLFDDLEAMVADAAELFKIFRNNQHNAHLSDADHTKHAANAHAKGRALSEKHKQTHAAHKAAGKKGFPHHPKA